MTKKMKILELVNRHKYLRREMVQQEFNLRLRTSQSILRNMAKNDKVLSRFKISRDQYIYHTENRSAKWAHWLAINEFHFALKRALKYPQRVLYYQLEYRYSHGQADGLYVVKTRADGGVMFFLEMDDGANQFDKVEKYERYFLSRQWVNEPWADPMNLGQPNFPIVLVVTPRVREIQKLAERAEKVHWAVYGDVKSAVASIIGKGV